MAGPAVGRMAVALGAGLALAGSLMPAWAAEPFSLEPLRQRVASRLPPNWRLEEVTVEAPTGQPTGAPAGTPAGTSETPATIGLSARVKLVKPTFTIDSRVGSYTFLRPAASAGTEKILTGTARALLKDGAWAVTLEWRNADLLDSLGAPAEELPGQTAILGSEEAKKLQALIEAEAAQRLAAEGARRRQGEQLLAETQAAAKAQTERVEAERAALEARTAQIHDLVTRLTRGERAARIAAIEAALGGNDPTLRQLASETALGARDPALAQLALKDWLRRKRSLPVLLFATKEDPTSEAVLRNLGPLTLEVESYQPLSGAIAGRLGAPGYSITQPSVASGALAQTELTINTYGCSLTVALSEHRTLDGLFRCQTLPTLVARVVLD